MKGIVFTEFIDMVEEEHSLDMVDAIIEDSELAHGGAYTAVGTYDPTEMGALVGALARRSGTKAPDLLHAFGRRTTRRFAEMFPRFFVGHHDVLSFLESIDSVIHVEVLKLYPDAELPRLETERLNGGILRLTYHSPRCMADFAEGLIEGAAAHFGDALALTRSQPRGAPSPIVVFTVARGA
jgi:hypothetical protein